MSSQIPSNKPIESLSIGNVVSAGLRIYKDNFKLYYLIAFKAYLWLIIPIYGWAKFANLSGLISRLAFSEVNERPETESEARSYIDPLLWNFFVTWLLAGLIIFGVTFVSAFLALIIFVILAGIFGQSSTSVIILFLLGIIAFLGFLFLYIWLFSRLSLSEFPIAIEDVRDATKAIARSWKLTKGYVLKLQLIFFVAYLISIPVSIAIQIITYIVQLFYLSIFANVFDPTFMFLLNLLLTMAASALLLPFWQSIKAVIYYDLRSRKEGMGLNLRKSG